MALQTAKQYIPKKLEPINAVEILRANSDFMEALDAYKEQINGGIDFLEPLDKKYVGNDHKVNQVVQVLEMKRDPVCMLMADAGEGKTTTAKHLMNVVNQQLSTLNLENYYVIFKMSVTHMKSLGLEKLERVMEDMLGEIEKLQQIAIEKTGIKELRFVAFFDESHKLIRVFGTSSKQGGDTLKESLTPAKVKVICATTRDEYDKTFSTDEPLDDRFEMVELDRVTKKNLAIMIRNEWDDCRTKPPIYPLNDLTDELVETVMTYTELFLPNKNEPRRSTKFIQRLEAKCRTERRQPSIEIVEEIFAEKRNAIDPKLDVNKAIESLKTELVGQELAKMQLIDFLYALKADTKGRGDKPIAKLFFAGPTGVGKTETSSILAKNLLDNGNVIFLDIPYYADDPEGGKMLLQELGRAVKHHPTSLVVVDEYEKGVPNSKNQFLKTNLQPLFLNLMNDGIVRWEEIDAEGLPHKYKQSLRNTIWVFTSNAGYEVFENEDKIGDTYEYGKMLDEFLKGIEDVNSIIESGTVTEIEATAKRNNIEEGLKNRFYKTYGISREFMGRMDAFVAFNGLGEYNATILAERQLLQYFKQYEKENHCTIHLDDKHLYKKEEIDGASQDTYFETISVLIGVSLGDMANSSAGGARRVTNVVRQQVKGRIGRALRRYEIEQEAKGIAPENIEHPKHIYLNVPNNGLATNGYTKEQLILKVRCE